MGILVSEGDVVSGDHDRSTNKWIPFRVLGEIGQSLPGGTLVAADLDSGADVEGAWRDVRQVGELCREDGNDLK